MNAKPSIITTTRISPDFYTLCKKNHIKFSEAMRVGIAICLAEKDIIGYDNDLNLMRQLKKVHLKLEETSQELYDLKNKIAKQTKENGK